MAFASVRGIDLYYELVESSKGAPCLLFISGSGGDLRQKPSLFDGPLAKQFRLLGYDQRGLGRSAIPPGPYTMGDYAEDVAGLLDTLDWQSCRVIGVSFGGMVAQEFAVRHPERVERMVLACTSSGGAGGASYPLHELAELPEDERLERNFELVDTRMDAAWRAQNPAAFERMVKFYRSRNEIGIDEPDRDLGQRLQFEARAGLDVYDRLPSLTMPVYLCGGRYDGIAPPSNMEAIAARLPDATLEFFDGGHLFLLQDRSAYPKIISFLAG